MSNISECFKAKLPSVLMFAKSRGENKLNNLCRDKLELQNLLSNFLNYMSDPESEKSAPKLKNEELAQNSLITTKKPINEVLLSVLKIGDSKKKLSCLINMFDFLLTRVSQYEELTNTLFNMSKGLTAAINDIDRQKKDVISNPKKIGILESSPLYRVCVPLHEEIVFLKQRFSLISEENCVLAQKVIHLETNAKKSGNSVNITDENWTIKSLSNREKVLEAKLNDVCSEEAQINEIRNEKISEGCFKRDNYMYIEKKIERTQKEKKKIEERITATKNYINFMKSSDGFFKGCTEQEQITLKELGWNAPSAKLTDKLRMLALCARLHNNRTLLVAFHLALKEENVLEYSDKRWKTVNYFKDDGMIQIFHNSLVRDVDAKNLTSVDLRNPMLKKEKEKNIKEHMSRSFSNKVKDKNKYSKSRRSRWTKVPIQINFNKAS